LLAGVILTVTRSRRWSGITLPLLAVGLALLNLILAQDFFVLGCVAGFWECP
jgi:hypothetical protein